MTARRLPGCKAKHTPYNLHISQADHFADSRGWLPENAGQNVSESHIADICDYAATSLQDHRTRVGGRGIGV